MAAADWGLLMVAAFAAGWVDAVVGGGGLILLPAILVVAPQLSAQAALATRASESGPPEHPTITGAGSMQSTTARRKR